MIILVTTTTTIIIIVMACMQKKTPRMLRLHSKKRTMTYIMRGFPMFDAREGRKKEVD